MNYLKTILLLMIMTITKLTLFMLNRPLLLNKYLMRRHYLQINQIRISTGRHLHILPKIITVPHMNGGGYRIK